MIHYNLYGEKGVQLTWSYLHKVCFGIKTLEPSYVIKIGLNCFEAAYATITLTNEDIQDDFEIDLCE